HLSAATSPSGIQRQPREGILSALGHSVAGMALLPQATSAYIAAEPRRLHIGLSSFGLLALLYALTFAFGHARGFGSVDPALLGLGDSRTFAQALLTVPVLMLLLAASAGVVQLALRAFGPVRGDFEDAAAVAALSLVVPVAVLMWLPDAVALVLTPA